MTKRNLEGMGLSHSHITANHWKQWMQESGGRSWCEDHGGAVEYYLLACFDGFAQPAFFSFFFLIGFCLCYYFGFGFWLFKIRFLRISLAVPELSLRIRLPLTEWRTTTPRIAAPKMQWAIIHQYVKNVPYSWILCRHSLNGGSFLLDESS